MKTRNKLYDKSRLRLLCLLTALLGIFGAGQIWAANGTTSGTSSTNRGAVVGGTAANIVGGQANNIYFGNYQQSSDGSGGYNTDPIRWRVLENAGGELFLLSDQNLDVFQYNIANLSVTWKTSTIRSWLNGYDASQNIGTGATGIDYTNDNFISTAFSDGERAAIAETNVVTADNGNVDGGEDTTDKIFLLSIEQAQESSFFSDNSSRIATNTAYVAGGGKIATSDTNGVGEANSWWLRSPGELAENVAYVTEDGSVYSSGESVDSYDVAVRPAFHLDLNSVLFTSAAAGGKPEGGLQEVTEYSGNEWKLTLKDSNRNFSVTEDTASGESGGTVTLHYAGATTGTNEYISVLLTDDQGNALYYGRVAKPETESGTVNVTIPTGLALGTYTLNVFSEQYNGDYQTDYASAFDAVSLAVYATPGQIDGVYQIKTADELFWFAALVNGTREGLSQNAAACAVLLNNITIPADMAWTPIGNASTIYTGIFDGQGYTISGMKIDNADGYSGLFGNVTGTVRDFTVTGSITVSSGATGLKVGGAVGSLGTASAGGTVSGVTSDVDITVTSGKGHIGGVVGSMPENSSPTVESCVYTGTLKSSVDADCVAGVVSYIRTGTIQNCANRGQVSVSGSGNVGGVLGYCNNGGIYIRNCYNTGTITGSGTNTVGAIVGNNNGTQATVSSCYYLTDSANKGQGQLTDDAAGTVVKTNDDFKSGAVAVLLQGDQTAQAWGQTLGTDDYPVPTTDEAMRVYAAKLYNGSADNVTDLYANASNFSSPKEANALLVIEDAASASTGTNIVVKNGDAYTCTNLVLTDGADFYTPVAFTAAQATYSRQLTTDTQWGTVALPFDATTVTGAELFRVASQEGDALYVDETGRMADGEPLVFRANADVTELSFKGTDVTVRATDAAATGSTLLVGTSQTVSPLAEGAYFIYGDKFYRVASGSQVGVKAFRAYIPAAAAGASTRSAGAASQLRIVFNADK